MHIPLPRGPADGGTGISAERALLRAAAELGRDEQPRLYRHVYSHGHATAMLARSFAADIGADSDAHTLDEIELGAHLHDFGKYLIAESILLKRGPLTSDERHAVSFHPIYGAHVLRGLPAVTQAVRRIVLHHHEGWDGSGYPEGMKGTHIPLEARIVAVVDVYTSLRARRAYKPALSRPEAAAEMIAMAGRELDPNLTEDFLRFVGAL
ncbi:MAG: HD domain-containing protein [Acidobacteria bacterium]|nr:HD domain-containing protein [Acidobacteriota bacterium]